MFDGGYMLEIREPTRCGLFRAGHNPHWIQMRLGLNDKDNSPTAGRFIEFRSSGIVEIEVENRTLTLWNHQPERMAEAAAASGGALAYQARWGLLWVASELGKHLFCVAASPENHLPCAVVSLVGSPTDLLKAAGGFLLPARELLMDEGS
jgi:hypothetical protein